MFQKIKQYYPMDRINKPPVFVVVCGGSGDGWTGGACKSLVRFKDEWNAEYSSTHPMFYISIHESTWMFINKSPKVACVNITLIL